MVLLQKTVEFLLKILQTEVEIICGKEFDNYPDRIKHLKFHIYKKQNVTCPHNNCTKQYNVLSSLTGHLSRAHKKNLSAVALNENIDDALNYQNDACINVNQEDDNNRALNEINDDDVRTNDVEDGPTVLNIFENNINNNASDLFVMNIAQFFLKLESELLLPVSTIQYICDAMNDIHIQGTEIVVQKLIKRLKDENVSEEKINSIVTMSLIAIRW